MHSYIFLESTEVHYSFYFSANIFAKSFFLPPSHLRLFWLQPRGCPGFLEKGVLHLLLGLLEEAVHLLLTIWESFTVCFACWNTRVYTSLFDVLWWMRYWRWWSLMIYKPGWISASPHISPLCLASPVFSPPESILFVKRFQKFVNKYAEIAIFEIDALLAPSGALVFTLVY